MASITSIPDPGVSPASQLATLIALTSAMRDLQQNVLSLQGNNQDLVNTLNYQTANQTASLTQEKIVRASADTTLASDITTAVATFNTDVASIQATLTTQATINTATASDITTLTANVGTNSAAITTNATAIAGINGTLSASYGVTLDTNGYMTGFNLLSTGVGTGTFDIRADVMRLVMPGYSAQPVMTINNLNGTPTLTFNGSIIADNSVQNASYSSGSLGNIKYAQGNPTATLTMTPIGRGPFLVMIFADGAQVPTYSSSTVTVKLNGTVVGTYAPSLIASGSTWYYTPLAKPILLTPSSGANTIIADYENVNGAFNNSIPCAVEIIVIELGA